MLNAASISCLLKMQFVTWKATVFWILLCCWKWSQVSSIAIFSLFLSHAANLRGACLWNDVFTWNLWHGEWQTHDAVFLLGEGSGFFYRWILSGCSIHFYGFAVLWFTIVVTEPMTAHHIQRSNLELAGWHSAVSQHIKNVWHIFCLRD